MKWVAIDLGRNEIKAAVRDIAGQPTKLLYNNNGRMYSYMPSEGFEYTHGKVYMGNYLPIVGALFPERICYSKAPETENSYFNTLFATIKDAASQHYNDSSIGVVLLYEKENNDKIIPIAKSYFAEVQQKCSSEVLSSVLYSNEGTSMIIDISMSALKMSLLEKGNAPAYYLSNELGFSTIDISEMIGYTITDNYTENYLHGQILEDVRIRLCQGKEDLFFGDVLNVDSSNSSIIKKNFEDCMTRYLYRCFDVCSKNLKQLSKNWNDINNIICCGSASNYVRMKETICEFLRGCSTDINALKITIYDKDAQWAAAFSTLQLPLLEESGVIVEF